MSRIFKELLSSYVKKAIISLTSTTIFKEPSQPSNVNIILEAASEVMAHNSISPTSGYRLRYD